jgi:spore germination protein YaaH
MMNKILFFIVIVQCSFLWIMLFSSGVPKLTLPSVSREDEKNETSVSPSPKLQKAELTGWFAAWDQSKAEETLPKVMNNFQTFSPMLYRVMADGSLGRHNITNRDFFIKSARDNNIAIAPVITDESSSTRVNRLLNNKLTQDKFIDQLVDEAKKENFIGWSIDIEQLKSRDRKAFTEFIKNASSQLHKNDLKLFVIVFGREEKETYDPALAHDYKELGVYADQVQLMTYNFNNDLTAPGGQTPGSWYRSVLKYAKKTIPQEKILVGLSTHGYDWSDGTVDGLTFSEAIDRIKKNGAKVSYNKEDLSMVASYKDEDNDIHSLWYEDKNTINEKIKIAREEYGVNKFALWRLTAEDPRFWD